MLMLIKGEILNDDKIMTSIQYKRKHVSKVFVNSGINEGPTDVLARLKREPQVYSQIKNVT